MAKRFYITKTAHKYDGTIHYKPECYKRFNTMEEAQKRAEELNIERSKEKYIELYMGWVNDNSKENEWADLEWYEEIKKGAFYYTFEAKESKSK